MHYNLVIYSIVYTLIIWGYRFHYCLFSPVPLHSKLAGQYRYYCRLFKPEVNLIKKIKLLFKSQKHRDVSVLLFPHHKFRYIRITDLIFTSVKRLSSSIPLSLHYRQQTLNAPEQTSGIRFTLKIKYYSCISMFPINTSSKYPSLQIKQFWRSRSFCDYICKNDTNVTTKNSFLRLSGFLFCLY